ncbi:hypothetical protein BDF20DRAFT_916400 [Mycotypha africana]|uniref:uncharacterized protein n=1 Tax=Mycotypha africana TaxID=64632 RepID=UPI00230121BE|nr:uncharacterized protein BDF20DRAFT_916400 [Mycotypha africana]KAI8968982.1 hypothetical protein BDF20DRAFT_916400 [Mycotypha africana]
MEPNSTFGKILEHCLKDIVLTSGPPIDLAQGGFHRESPTSIKTHEPPELLTYADDVVLIADRRHLPLLLHQCEQHSYTLGYSWNPDKCFILDPHNGPLTYRLYGTPLTPII